MKYAKEEAVFEKYISSGKLKQSKQRKNIMQAFLESGKHVTAEELYNAVKRKFPSVGLITVYRTLKLFCKCGLAREVCFENGTARYEHLYGRQHHDHLICSACGKVIEIEDPDIEKLQDRQYKMHGFVPQGHRMDLYGICRKCRMCQR
ncbi:MAG: transcriptional repressor [Elusimicrobia bacterium]|nr:transcriptional repressor [Elusimicrobiota bacterium]